MSRNVSDAKKKNVAGKQYFKCANEPGKKLRGLDGYKCPLWQIPGRNQGCFDESGYEIDHIIEYCISKNDSVKNLHALCKMCHLVKTKRFAMSERSDSSNDETDETDDSDDELIIKKIPTKEVMSLTSPTNNFSSEIIISGFDYCECDSDSLCDCEFDDDIITDREYFKMMYKSYCDDKRKYSRTYNGVKKFLENKPVSYFNKFINAWIRDLDEFDGIIGLIFIGKIVSSCEEYFDKEPSGNEFIGAEAAMRDAICEMMCVYNNKLCRELKQS